MRNVLGTFRMKNDIFIFFIWWCIVCAWIGYFIGNIYMMVINSSVVILTWVIWGTYNYFIRKKKRIVSQLVKDSDL